MKRRGKKEAEKEKELQWTLEGHGFELHGPTHTPLDSGSWTAHTVHTMLLSCSRASSTYGIHIHRGLTAVTLQFSAEREVNAPNPQPVEESTVCV